MKVVKNSATYALMVALAITLSTFARAATTPGNVEVYSATEDEATPEATPQRIAPPQSLNAPPVENRQTTRSRRGSRPKKLPKSLRTAKAKSKPTPKTEPTTVLDFTHGAAAQEAGIAATPAPVEHKGKRGDLSERGRYDPVPSDQVDSLVLRLRLVEEIIQRHGRAYDYRIHTTPELRTILTELDHSVRPKVPSSALAGAPKRAMKAEVSHPASGEIPLMGDPLPPEPTEEETSGGETGN